jgi:hypothetical protein
MVLARRGGVSLAAYQAARRKVRRRHTSVSPATSASISASLRSGSGSALPSGAARSGNLSYWSISLVDFAIEAQRNRGLAPVDTIRVACLQRFRPIMMTTMAVLLGGVPLMLGTGTGAGSRSAMPSYPAR